MLLQILKHFLCRVLVVEDKVKLNTVLHRLYKLSPKIDIALSLLCCIFVLVIKANSFMLLKQLVNNFCKFHVITFDSPFKRTDLHLPVIESNVKLTIHPRRKEYLDILSLKVLTTKNFPYVDSLLFSPYDILTYPAAADPITISSAAVAWGFGDWVEIVPADTITYDFGIMGVLVYNTDNDHALIEIGTGAYGAEVTEIQIPSFGNTYTPVQIIMLAPGREVAANSRVSARAADPSAVSGIIRLK